VSPDAVAKGERKLLNSSDVIASLRDLIVHLHRSNGPRAETIVEEVSACLKQTIDSGADPGTEQMQRTQQTMFAIEEVRVLLQQRDYEGAAVAARDAAKEWRQPPPPK